MTTTTADDQFLGRDGCGSDEIVTEYYRRGTRLIERCNYGGNERVVTPAVAIAELERRAGVSRGMAETCSRQGGPAGDYPDRVRACESAAEAIRKAFPE